MLINIFFILIILLFDVINSLKYLEYSEIKTDNFQLKNLALLKTPSSSADNDNYLGRNNILEYNGKVYSTLGDVPINGIAELCQNSYEYLPLGWEIAPDNDDTEKIIGLYYWSTYYMVTEGKTRSTKRNNGTLLHGTHAYKVWNNDIGYYASTCNSQILIVMDPQFRRTNLINAINGNTVDTGTSYSMEHNTFIKYNASHPTWYMIDLGKPMDFTDIQVYNGRFPTSMEYGYEIRAGNSPNALDNPICVVRGGLTLTDGSPYYCPAFAQFVVIRQTALPPTGGFNTGYYGMWFKQIEIYNKPRNDKINFAYMKNVTASHALSSDTCGAELNIITNGQTGLNTGSCFTRAKLIYASKPWFMIDLGEEIDFTDIIITGSIISEMSNFHILVGNSPNALDNPICHSNADLIHYSEDNYLNIGVPFECKSRARYVVIYSQLNSHYLQLNQVEVYNRPKYYEPLPNLAFNQNASQHKNISTTYNHAHMAVNGYGVYEMCTQPSSNNFYSKNDNNPWVLTNNWWMVDLGSKQEFTEIVIWAVNDYAVSLSNIDIRVGNSPNAMENPIVVRKANIKNTRYGVKFYIPTSNSKYVVIGSNVNTPLILCQVEVYNRHTIRYDMDVSNFRISNDKRVNLAYHKSTSQSSYHSSCGNSAYGVNGFTAPQYTISNCLYLIYTNSGPNQWWMVDLGLVMDITDVVIYNTANSNGDRLSNFHIRAGNSPNALSNPICYSNGNLYPYVYVYDGVNFACSVQNARYVVIHSLRNDYLTFGEVEVYNNVDIPNSKSFMSYKKTIAEVNDTLQVFTGENIKQYYTVPNDVYLLKIWIGGAGGGGGSATRLSDATGSGGGSGAVAYTTWNCTPGDIIEISIGKVGKGGSFGDDGSKGGGN
jgi:hypothetical protein